MTNPEVDNPRPGERGPRRPRLATLAATAGLLAAFVILGVLVALQWTPLVDADMATDVSMHTLVLSDRALLTSAVAVTNAGGPLSVDLITGLAAAGLLIRRRFRMAIYLGAARIVELAVETAAKHVVGRPRPVLPYPVAHGGGFSYPSGHTSGTTVLCGSLLVLALPVMRSRWRALSIILAALAIAAVAASRVMLGVHYPSDVLAGSLLGAACALGLTPLLPTSRVPEEARNRM